VVVVAFVSRDTGSLAHGNHVHLGLVVVTRPDVDFTSGVHHAVFVCEVSVDHVMTVAGEAHVLSAEHGLLHFEAVIVSVGVKETKVHGFLFVFLAVLLIVGTLSKHGGVGLGFGGSNASEVSAVGPGFSGGDTSGVSEAGKVGSASGCGNLSEVSLMTAVEVSFDRVTSSLANEMPVSIALEIVPVSIAVHLNTVLSSAPVVRLSSLPFSEAASLTS